MSQLQEVITNHRRALQINCPLTFWPELRSTRILTIASNLYDRYLILAIVLLLAMLAELKDNDFPSIGVDAFAAAFIICSALVAMTLYKEKSEQRECATILQHFGDNDRRELARLVRDDHLLSCLEPFYEVEHIRQWLVEKHFGISVDLMSDRDETVLSAIEYIFDLKNHGYRYDQKMVHEVYEGVIGSATAADSKAKMQELVRNL